MIAKNKQLSEVLEDMRNGTYDMTDNGVCTQCGACCSNLLPLTDKEIKRIRGYIKKHQIEEYKYMIPIYPVRPEICRQFICSPLKRKPFISNENYHIVDVRKEFFR